MWMEAQDRFQISASDHAIRLSLTIKMQSLRDAEEYFENIPNSTSKKAAFLTLLNSYVQKRATEKGGRPNYKTWEILMEGCVEERKMDKAIAAMENGIAMLEHCEWRPSSSIVLAIAVYYENNAKCEEAKQYLTEIRRFRLASLPVYKSLHRMHVSNQSPANDILEMDDEILKLVQASSDVSLGIDVK